MFFFFKPGKWCFCSHLASFCWDVWVCYIQVDQKRKGRLKSKVQRQVVFSYLIGIANHGRSFSLTSLNYLEEENACESANLRLQQAHDYGPGSSVAEDEGYGQKAPGVVARLMGLDSLPTSKVQSRSIERFQSELLPPKSAKPTSVTPPIKSPEFVPPKNAAAKVYEQSPRPATREKVQSSGSSSVPLRIWDLRDKREAARRQSRIYEASRKPTGQNSVKSVRRQPCERGQIQSDGTRQCRTSYRRILVTPLKSYMRTHLEDTAVKDATEKSDAASEAFLAELARDSKNSSGAGNGCSKHTHEKVKDKKKNRAYRKTKGSRPTSGNEPHFLRHQTMEDISFAVTCDGENQGVETVGNSDSLNEQGEEYRRRIELEAEEKKLEETLEYQRRMEYEAKPKHLPEETKRTAKTCPGSIDAVMKSDTCSKYGDNGQVIDEQLKSSKKKNKFPDSLGSLPKIDAEEMSQRTVTLEGSTLVSTPHSGRRGRRQNASKLIDGNFQSAFDEKENTEVGEPIALHSSHGVNGSEDSGTKTLRQLPVEDDDEETFQADLKKAVRQSLDTFHAHKKLPLLPSSGNGRKVFPEAGTLGSANSIGDVNKMDAYGTGLKNEVGEYNCFLNVIIQSLWHLRRFRDEFLRTSSEHVHVGDPCVICALYDIFTALSTGSTETRRKTVAPTSLRIALSNLYPDSNFFQEGQMNDASEVLGVIFDSLHRSFTSASGVSDTESADTSCMGTWDCSNGACIAHSLFGMDILELMNCYNCGLESRHLKYTSFFHNINASALRTMKVMRPESSFDALLNLVEMNHQLSCYSEDGECGKLNCIHHILSTPPHVFTAVLGWQNTCESVVDITATLSSLSTEVDIGVLYHGLHPKNKHCLISMVCYYGQHYNCFAYSRDHGQWVMYDDETVKVIGGWDDVLVMCERGHLQPQVLFYEAVK